MKDEKDNQDQKEKAEIRKANLAKAMKRVIQNKIESDKFSPNISLLDEPIEKIELEFPINKAFALKPGVKIKRLKKEIKETKENK